jgi:hypothetical protein
MSAVIQVIKSGIIFKIDVGHSKGVFSTRGVLFSVAYWPGTEPFEFHDILSQSASFVREDIVDHSELVIEIARLDLTELIFLTIVHGNVIHYEGALSELAKFQSHKQ